MRRVIDWPFFGATLVVTGLFCFELASHAHTALAWIVLVLSVIPLYATVYEVGFLFKAALFHRHWTQPLRPRRRAERSPGIAFLIASYQEPFDVAKMTFDCARDAQYGGPREIIVVDNSGDTDSEDYRRWKSYVESHDGRDPQLRVLFRYNEKKGGLKPGNVDLAQSLIAEAEYVVLLDIDSSLPLHGPLLETAVNEFECDERLGVLQFDTMATNDHFNGLTGPVTVVQSAMHVSQLIRGSGGFAIFYGHNAMWRRSVLEASGPWLDHYRGTVMLSEDLLKTVGAYANGHTSRYLDMATGEWVPSSLRSLETMYRRWAYGTFQVLFKRFHRILTTRGFTVLEKVDLVLSMVGYVTGAVFFPLSVLWFFCFPVGHAAALTWFMLLAPPLASAWLVYVRYTRRLRSPLASRLFDLYAGVFAVRTFTLLVGMRSAMNFLFGVKQGWRVTAKGFETRPSMGQALRDNTFVAAVGLVILIGCLVSWGVRTGFSAGGLLSFAPTLFIAVNLLLCVLVYGRQARSPGGTLEGTGIDGFMLRNSVLDKVPLFHGTNAKFQHNLALALEPVSYPAGATIITKGEPGHALYLVAEGEVAVSNGRQRIRSLQEGSFFGERSLFLDEPRSATVTAQTRCELFRLDKTTFMEVLRAQPKVARRVVHQAESYIRTDLQRALTGPPGHE
ncbi:cyclic nucleotide-binding domain-containing protein [Kitasatospora sp. NPDC048540]|uniref:cyclic nucleotide-binding domain-containing protein n=1 Tax=unclassified Kitasatospora TaxID=2633591 RepID=UPI00053BAA5E|nr:cyclic nucleotide-binding domain-containing protein [Kitasatospora sp. MBT63]